MDSGFLSLYVYGSMDMFPQKIIIVFLTVFINMDHYREKKVRRMKDMTIIIY